MYVYDDYISVWNFVLKYQANTANPEKTAKNSKGLLFAAPGIYGV